MSPFDCALLKIGCYRPLLRSLVQNFRYTWVLPKLKQPVKHQQIGVTRCIAQLQFEIFCSFLSVRMKTSMVESRTHILFVSYLSSLAMPYIVSFNMVARRLDPAVQAIVNKSFEYCCSLQFLNSVNL